MEGNVAHILADNLLWTPFVFLSYAAQMSGAVLQKPLTRIPPSFYPLNLNTVILYSEVDSGSHLRGKVKAKAWKLVDRKWLFNLEENST